MSPEVRDDFLPRRRSEVLDLAHPIESDAPSSIEFGDARRQQFDFAVIVRCNINIDEHDLAE
jgi:hypothetical protein